MGSRLGINGLTKTLDESLLNSTSGMSASQHLFETHFSVREKAAAQTDVSHEP